MQSNVLLKISDADLHQLRHSDGRYAQFLSGICKFYRDWHVKSDGVYGNLLLINYNIVDFLNMITHQKNNLNLISLFYLLKFLGEHLLD